MNVAAYLYEAAEQHPRQPAILQGAASVTYAELADRVSRIARGLQELGVAPGDRVAMLLPNGTPFLEALFATFAAGGVVVPVNSRLHPKEYGYVVEHSDARAVVFAERFADGIAALGLEARGVARVCVDGTVGDATLDDLRSSVRSATHAARDADDVAWLFYTSGTTGRPKGAMITHGNLSFMSDRYPVEVYPAGPDDRALHAGPLTHGSGLWSIPLTRAASAHVLPPNGAFDPVEILEIVETRRVTKLVFLAPTMVKMLLEAPGSKDADCSSLRFVGYGGAPIHPSDLDAALERWGPVLCNIYGQGECPMTITMLSPEDHADALVQRPGHLRTVGRPRGGIEVAVCDAHGKRLPAGEVGEVCVKGPVVMRGYWNDAGATEEAFRHGWYHTGDLGRFDGDGFLHLLDRMKELIISGGANIYPREVEEVLARHPAVVEVAVFGIPDRHWGESVVAAVVARPGHAVEPDALVALCQDNLASYKKPRFVTVVDELPRNATGKVQRRELAERYGHLATER